MSATIANLFLLCQPEEFLSFDLSSELSGLVIPDGTAGRPKRAFPPVARCREREHLTDSLRPAVAHLAAVRRCSSSTTFRFAFSSFESPDANSGGSHRTSSARSLPTCYAACGTLIISIPPIEIPAGRAPALSHDPMTSQNLFTAPTGVCNAGQLIPILSYGMGVESTAILLRYLEEPDTFEFDLSELIVIVAMTGDEWDNTRTDVEEHVLPRLRENNVRLVQLARAGPSQKDGIIVLDDSCQPRRLYTEGAFKLSDELQASGTVPAFTGEHRCSLKFKAFVIESWLQQHVYPASIRHTFGYNSDELGRVAKSNKAIARITFGFNADEQARVKKGQSYDHPYRIGHYPLVEIGWDRQDCLLYIREATGIDWQKSACPYCPFTRIDADTIERQKRFPHQVAKAMILERLSLAMNPRGQLYKKQPLYQIVNASGNETALESFHASLASVPWGLYRVRRIYQPKAVYQGTGRNRRLLHYEPTKKGSVQRCVERIAQFSTAGEAIEQLKRLAQENKLPVEINHELCYATVRRCGQCYPTSEEYYVAAPAVVETKARHGVSDFHNEWISLGDLYCGKDDIPTLFS
jgi:hypothetical protein